MAGELVPLVLLPRYTTYAGNTAFTTIAMDVTEFQNAILNCWRGDLIGTAPSFGLTFQESTDQVSWSTCAGTTAAWDPTSTESQATAQLKKRWFRVVVQLGGVDNIATCWIVGFLEERLA
jgi:hypothetical protein